MPVEVQMNTPLAEKLQGDVQRKLADNGWAPGDASDTTMAEYLILMVVNGKVEDEIASELATDLLNLEPGDNAAREFSHWLFQTIDAESRRLNAPEDAPQAQATDVTQYGSTGDQDMDMDMSTDLASPAAGAHDLHPPTGPKALRSGPGNFRGRSDGRGDKRILGQANRHMDRGNNDQVLHRIRGQGGATDRINSHTRGGANGRGGMGGFGNGRQQRHMNGRQQASFNHALTNMAAGGAGQANWMGGMGLPGQPPMAAGAMDVFAMLEQQSRMMQQMQQQMQQQQNMMANQNRRGAMNGRGRGHDRGRGYHNGHNGHGSNGHGHGKGHDDIVLGDLGDLNEILGKDGKGEGADDDVDMEGKASGGHGGPAEVLCKFNLRCTNKDCKFAHQSPAAPPGTLVNTSEVCTFGAACKNSKCTGRHPSPAARAAHNSEQDCKYFPNCTNPHCTFKHPSMPLCRNGADCTAPGCKFTHVTTMCRFRPCTNRYCTFKHEEGQRGAFPDKVWTADGAGAAHISERKFVDETAAEETILPDSAGTAGTTGTTATDAGNAAPIVQPAADGDDAVIT